MGSSGSRFLRKKDFPNSCKGETRGRLVARLVRVSLRARLVREFHPKGDGGGATPLRPCRRIPYLPGGFGLEVEHLKAVFGDGSVLPSPT